MINLPSTKAFFENIIDFAGLFPPGNLSLKHAVQKYAKELNGKDSWVLGPFVIPITRLDEITDFAELFIKSKPLQISVVGRKSHSVQEYFFNLKKDLEIMQAFSLQNKEWANIAVLETTLPPDIQSLKEFQEISYITNRLNMKIFCEIPLPAGDNWKQKLKYTLSQISVVNLKQNGNKKIGVKLRTGGLTANMFPCPEQVAGVLAACRDFDLPMKFTAGLHNPIRMFREEVQTKMHGFLNIFIAGLLAEKYQLYEEIISELLSDENSEHFSVERDFFAWKNYRISTDEIKEFRRNRLCSFGSCSIDEPREEFLNFMKQQEVI